MSFLKKLLNWSDKSKKKINEHVSSVEISSKRLADIVNESLQIAKKSSNLDTKRSRLRVAKDTLAELKEMATQFPFLKLTQLEEVEKSIIVIEKDIEKVKANQNKLNVDLGRPFIDQAFDMAEWNDETFDGVRFSAVLNIKTPLKYLLIDGAVKTSDDAKEIKLDPSHGSWLPNMREEYIVNTHSNRASQFGAVPKNGGNVLPSLIEFRTILEREFDRHDENLLPEFKNRAKEIVDKTPIAFTSLDKCLEFIFKELIMDVKHLTGSNLLELISDNVTSLKDLKNMDEESLKKLKGIGAKKAESITFQLSKII